MTCSRPVAWLLASGLWVSALVGAPMTARAGEVGGAEESPAAPASSLEDLRARWEKEPGEVLLGLRFQDALLAAGRRDEALAVFRRHRASRRDDPAAAFLLGRVEGGPAGTKAMAAALAKDLGLPSPTAEVLAEASRVLAQALEAEGELAGAADAAARRADLLGTAEAWMRAGALRERAGDRDAAERAYRAAIGRQADGAGAREALALLLARTGRAKEALQLADDTVRARPEAAESFLHQGLVRSLCGNRKGALVSYAKALDRAQGDPKVLRALAATYVEMEELDLARQALDRARELEPEEGTQLLQSAALALQRGETVEAERLLARAARALPDSAPVAYLQGVAAQRQEQGEAAVAAFRRAVEREPRTAAYALALALALQEAGKVDAAIDALEAAAKRVPGDPDVRLRLGFLQMQKRRWGKAAEAFGAAAAAAPADPDPHFYLAVVYGDRLRKTAPALEHLREYKRLGGTEPSALRWLEELEGAEGR